MGAIDDTSIEWSGYNWLTRERWGRVHSGRPDVWYDPSCIQITDKGSLLLTAKVNPTTLIDGGNTYNSTNGIGLISCTENFSFGRFEIYARLPSGIGLWPAFWMWATDAWPPEIDIFEAYSGTHDYKNNFFKPYRVESCIHARKEWGTKGVRAKAPCRLKFNEPPGLTLNRYACEWTKDRIEFFINEKSVRKVTDEKLLGLISNYKMQLIINIHIDNNFADRWSCERPFEVKWFKYTAV